MTLEDERIAQAVKQTEILRSPRQNLATFGTTNVYYYLVTEPTYSDLVGKANEVVIREGRVIAERPKVVTPFYLSQLDGFGTGARRYLEMLLGTYGPDAPGLFYSYRNEPKELSIVSDNFTSVIEKLNADIDRRGDPLTSIIRGVDDLWDVSIMKFIFELTRGSVSRDLRQMGPLGLLDVDSSGVPGDARRNIEDLFRSVARGECDPHELKKELDRWGLFGEYQDRFLGLLRKK